jgi:segregation and condensation protein B
MSLKARLEAVIYAAEEPVTLTQLAALFAADALEWKAAQEAASAEAAGPESAAAEPLPLLNAEFDYAEMEQPSETAAEPEAGDFAAPAADPVAETATAETPAGEPTADSPSGNAADPAADAEPAADPPVDPEAEAKRLAKARDREVRAILRIQLDELIATYASDDRGIEIKEIAGGYRMATKPECHDAARMFVKSLKPALKLSLPALETLAVIAYKQPVTAPEVNEIRGVDSSGVFGSLLARKLIATAGRKQVIGRPILYKTTKEFLLKFGLNDVSELPSMEEFEKIAQLEFEDMEPVAEGEAGEAAVDAAPDEDSESESDENNDQPVSEAAETTAPEAGKAVSAEEESKEESSREEAPVEEKDKTAAMADSNPAPVTEEQEPPETPADLPATQAETTPAEAAPAAPSPLEQAETETVPHD